MQTHRQSVVEALVNTAVGFVGSYLITYLFMLKMNPTAPAGASLAVVLACTVWSVVRGYYLRRLFNRLHRPKGQEVQQ